MQITKIAVYMFMSVVALFIGWMVGMQFFNHFPTIPSLYGQYYLTDRLPAEFVSTINFWAPITDFVRDIGWSMVWLVASLVIMLVAEKFVFGKLSTKHHKLCLGTGMFAIVSLAILESSDLFEIISLGGIGLCHIYNVVMTNWPEEQETEPRVYQEQL